MPTVTATDGDIKTWDDALKQEVWSPPSAVAVGDTASYKGESSPTATEFSYLHLVTGPIQSQINGRAPLASPALTGTPTVNGVAFGPAAFKNTGTAAGEIPLLGAGGKLPSSTLPALAITDTFVVASQAAMLALSAAETGDVAVRTDLNKSFILRGANPAVLADWQELLTPTDSVFSVNGQTGVVVLTTQHITEHASNLYHTPARVNTLIAAQVGVTVQAYDPGLAALAAFNTNGLLVQTADNTFAGRTLTAPAAGLTITNPAGTAGNPTFALANDLAALEGLGSTGIAVRTAADTWAQRSVTVTASTGLAVTNGDGVAGNITLAGVDASTTVKGVASFNSTNFSVASGAVNTVQNINTGATPTFGGLTLANATRPTLVIDTTGTTGKGRAHAAIANFLSIAQNAVYSGAWNLDDTSLSGWQANLDSRSGSDAFTVARMSAGTNPRTPVDLLKIDGAGLITFNNAIRSTSYTAGLVGFSVNAAGDIEANNIRARGEFLSAVFKYNEVMATGGTQFVAPSASTLATDFTTPSSVSGTGSMVVKNTDAGAPLFSTSSRLRLRAFTGAAVHDSWLTVTSVTNNGATSTLGVTLQSGSTSATFRAGTAVIDYGASGAGTIALSTDGAVGASPSITLATHAGSPWSAQTTVARLGNLNGAYGYSNATYGLGVGQYGVAGQSWIVAATDAGGDATKSGLRLGNNTTTVIHLKNDGSGYLANSSISWNTAGVLTVSANATIAGWAVTSTLLSSGSGASSVGLSSAGGVAIYAGHATPTSAPFRVTAAGALTATSADITGTVTASAGAVGGWTIAAGKLSATGIDLVSGATAYAAFGSTPPPAANSGTGVFINSTGFYGLAAGVAQVKVDAATGKLTAGAGIFTADADGVWFDSFNGTADQRAVRWVTSGELTGAVSNGYSTPSGAASGVSVTTISAACRAAATAGTALLDMRAQNNLGAGVIMTFTVNGAVSLPGGTSKVELNASFTTFQGFIVNGSGTPGATLDVRGTGIFTGPLVVNSSSITSGFQFDANGFGRVRSGLVIGAELGGYVISGNHRLQVIATGTQSIAMFQGGSGAVEIWKDTTPTKAGAFGMAVPGNTITDDFIFSTFSSAAPPYWFERMRITNAGALKLAAYGAGTLRTDSAGNVTAAAAVSVTGSRGGNAALASLLTQLAALGVIADNTTA